MKIIGLTGNSGAGKSTVCEILKKKYQVAVIDADQVAKQLTQETSAYLEDIVKQFGDEIINEEGKLNRKRLADLIYNNHQKREALNQITFIHVVEEIKRQIEAIKKEKVVVIDAPLLFESGLDKLCDATIGVFARSTTKLERICRRDKIDETTAKKRIAIQLQDEYLKQQVDYIIQNDSTVEQLEEKIKNLPIFS